MSDEGSDVAVTDDMDEGDEIETSLDSLIVGRYISSVLIVDDQPTFAVDAPVTASATEAAAQPLEAPIGGAPTAGLAVPDEADLESHELPAGPVTRAFADIGMMCGIVEPFGQTGEPINSKVAARADVVILDWRLRSGEPVGASATALLRDLVSPDRRQPLRLVCIYTAEPNVAAIAGEIAESFGVETESEFAVKISSTRVIVLGKPGNLACDEDRQVEWSALPARLLAEYLVVVDGLLPLFSLAAIGALRDASGLVVSRFDALIDPAVLGHRTMLPQPADLVEHLVDALTDEFRAVVSADLLVEGSLSEERCWQVASGSVIAEDELPAIDARFTNANPMAEVERMVRLGTPTGGKIRQAKYATRLFSSGGPAATTADIRFASLLHSRSHYMTSPPTLGLGAIVELVAEDAAGIPVGYYLCLKALCDSARLEAAEPFALSPLATTLTAPVTFVIDDDSVPRPLAAQIDLSLVVHAPFAPSEAPGPVQASYDNGQWVFLSAHDEPARFRYVGRLRDAFAQRSVHELATQASRIGLNDAEWVRVKRPAEG
ncbi:response regulator receiver domain [Iamia majanohamensis]|uniref:Response regulator receiver domain n=1 Tax=Iamia majanohamensis TaxID=467976 RepID=A0AAF0BTH2_9ACTN|nr:response regulator receiver domain [Iamia majanohamensis]WCO66817.1 response regulator receiver domain [Iamia majanohamensis]